MVHRLSNMDKEDGLRERVVLAAKNSGQDVRLENGPMPPHGFDEEAYYNRAYLSGELDHLDHIAGYEEVRDYSAFWREYRKLK